ncbi:MAG: flagellar hook-associated protein FlgK, partial [Pseudomonadota bacterium]
MGVSSALSAALAGLRFAQSGLDFTAQNVASASLPGYTRKVLQPNQRVIDGKVVGIESTSVARVLDTLLQKQLRTESGGNQYAKINSSYLERLDGLYGPPGSTTALDSVFADFTSALEQLATSPESTQSQSNALEKAKLFTSRLNGISSDIQAMRSEAEQGISDSVNHINDLLKSLEGINKQIIASSATAEPVNLLDQRDRILNQLGTLMDIKVKTNRDNGVTVYAGSGTLLFDAVPAKLTFDARTNLTPESAYSTDPNQRTVGTITLTTPGGYAVDLIGQNAIRSGSIASYISLRDDVLVKAQTHLDELASSMALALSSRTQASTAITDGRQIDLASVQPGDSITLNVTSGGIPRTVTIVRVDDPSQLPISASDVAGTTGEVYGVDFSNLGNAATAIQNILGTGFTVSNPGGTLLNVTDDGVVGNTNVTGLSGRISATTPPEKTEPGCAR